MTFPKPDMKYTEMAIYVDEHIYTEECDKDKAFLCIYHLALMLAYKGRIFTRKEYYREFAFFFATKIYDRLKDPRQYAIIENGEPELAPIKSVLNYMKATLYSSKVDFEQLTYSQSHSLNPYGDTDYNDSEYRVVNKIRYFTDNFNAVETELCLRNLHKIIQACLQDSPYFNNKKEWHDIYMSCLLTVLNSFTLSALDKQAVDAIHRDDKHKENFKTVAINNLYASKNNTGVILYHLDESMVDYIQIQVRKIIKYLNETLEINTFLFEEKNLLAATIEELEGENCNLVVYN